MTNCAFAARFLARAAAAVALSAALLQAPPAEAAPTANGRVVFGNATTTPQNRVYTAGSPGTFAAAAATVAGAIPTFVVERAARTRNEHIAGYVTTGGVLYVMRWNGTSWSNEWNVTVGGTGVNGRRFDIAYETTTGNAVVLYSNNANSQLRYNSWNGTAWAYTTASAPTVTSARLTGIPNSIKVTSRNASGSNAIAAAIADANSDLTALIWNGTAWANEPTAALSTILQQTSVAGDKDVFDVAYENQSGDLFLVYSETTPANYYRTFTSSTSTWSAAITLSATGRTVFSMFAVADPDPASNRVVAGFDRSASANRYAVVWDGTTLGALTTAGNNANATNPPANSHQMTGAWLTSGTSKRAVVVYQSTTTTNIDYAYYDVTAAIWTVTQAATGYTSGDKRWVDMAVDPRSSDTLMLTYSDANAALWAKQLVYDGTTLAWGNADGGSAVATGLTNTTTQSFDFAYDRFTTTLTIGNGADPTPGTWNAGTTTAVDQFQLTTSPSGVSTVTQLPVALTGNAAVSSIALYSGTTCGGTLLGTVTTPGATATFTGLSLVATTTSSTYTICATAGAVATATTFSANVTTPLTQTGAGLVTDSDTGPSFTVQPSTVTLATGSFDPAANTSILQGTTALVDSFTLQSGFGTATIATVTLAITGNTLLSSVAIMDNVACSGGTTYGSQASPGTSQSITVTGMTAVQPTATTFYVCGTATATANGSVKANVSGFTATSYATGGTDTSNTLLAGPVYKTIAGTVTAAASPSVCTAIAVTAPYTGDANTSNTLSYRTRTPTGTGAWSTSTNLAHSASPYSFNITGTLGATYDVEVTYVDTADGIIGTAVQTVSGITVGASCQTSPGSLTGTIVTCTQVSLAASYAGDSNNNNTVAFARGTDGLTFGTPICAATGGGSNPRTCTDQIAPIGPNTNWYYRATYADGEGVVGGTTRDSGLVAIGACAPNLAVAVGSPVPAAANVAAGSSGTIVGRIALTPSGGAVTLSSISIANTLSGGGGGTAVAGVDVSSLALFDVTNATTVFVGSGNWNASTSHYDFTSLSYIIPLTGATFAVALNVNPGATATRTFAVNVSTTDVTVVAPYTVTVTAIQGNTFTITAGTGGGSTNTSAPMVSIVNPLSGALVSPGGPVSNQYKVQIRVFNKVGNLGIDGITASSVKLSTDNGATFPLTATANTKYDAIFSDPNWATTVTGRTYEVLVTSPAQGSYTLRARAANSVPVTVTSEPVSVVVAASGRGDGNLLVRDRSSQLCADCHALPTHGSEALGTKYGAWSTTCRDCHTPHGTRNIMLVRESITPPSVGGVLQTARNVGFVKTTGDTNALGWTGSGPSATASYTNSDNTGPCQVCHTRTGGATARYRNTGNADTHYTSAVGTADCKGCHRHNAGFAGGDCVQCHSQQQLITKGPLAGQAQYRRPVSGEFGKAWSHKRNGGKAATKYDCGVCHMEGDAKTGGTTGVHADGYVDLRDPDTGLQIQDVTPPPAGSSASYTSAGTTTKYERFSRNLSSNAIEPFAAATMINQCLHCHDKNGATNAAAQVTGGTPGKPFATTIAVAQGTYTGASGLTACTTGTDGCVVDVDSSFVTTNASYHPIKGRQNNWYAKDTNRAQTPWTGAARGATADTTSWGYLITCWDCHADNAAAGPQTSTVTAHGGDVTIRQAVWVQSTVTNGAIGAGNLCIVCHKIATNVSAQTHDLGSAWLTTGNSTPGSRARDACYYCHSSSITSPVRPIRGQDAHGFDTFALGMGTDKLWPVGATETFRPYAFIRSVGTGGVWNNATGWNPKSAPGFTGSATCGTGTGSGCNQTGMGPYTPGGIY